MVMHARKLPRLDDGYFDKHQSHPYQANQKYSANKGTYDRYSERARDSPNGTSLRSDSPGSYGDSPRDRSYVHKGSYAQRVREKERERDNRSPRDRERAREADRRTNHDRGPPTGSSHSSDEKPQRVGDWSEHVSSSGKKYYYNCKSEVSQWEKPREWVDWEKERERNEERERERERYRTRDRDRGSSSKYERPSYPSSSRSSSGPIERHSNFNRPSATTMSNSNSSHNHSINHSSTARSNLDGRDLNSHRTPQPTSQSTAQLSQSLSEQQTPSRRHSYERPSQDMDISPADSTPTSEASGPKAATPYTPDPRLTPTQHGPSNSSHSNNSTTPVSLATALPRLLSHPTTSSSSSSTPRNVHTSSASSRGTHLMSPSTTTPTTSTSLSSLQQLLTQLTRTTASGSMTAINPAIQSMLASTLGSLGNLTALGSLQSLERMELPAHEVLQSLQTLLSSSSSSQLAVHVTTPSSSSSSSSSCSSSVSAGIQPKISMSTASSGHADGFAPSTVPTPPENDVPSTAAANGPPTPTHSERLETDFRRGSPASTLSSLSAATASLRPSGSGSSALTPSLATHYRLDLISHVTGWPAEHLEKQATKVGEELQHIGNVLVTKVSAELKMARSLVRVADIQATLQEQRILFLRQQMKLLEELKPPNHFMSD